METNVLEIHGLTVSFSMYASQLEKRQMTVIRDLSLTVRPGEILAVIGSSGSGKSILAHAILGLLPDNAAVSGRMSLMGQAVTQDRMDLWRGRRIALAPQSVSYLDPLMKVGKQVCGPGRTKEREARRRRAFSRYGLAESTARLYPHQCSGGMIRRVLAATAEMEDVDLILADEPTPGMDLSSARAAMAFYRSFADEGKGVLLITHDLDAALDTADRVAVFYAGTILELCGAARFHGDGEELRHPYTRALWNALPQNGFTALPGRQPLCQDVEGGCAFFARCPVKRSACQGDIPWTAYDGGEVRCVQYAGR